MNRNLYELYLYAVCLLTLTCGMVTLGFFSYNIVRICKPEFTLSGYELQSISSNDEFKRTYAPPPKENEETLTHLREEKFKLLINLEKKAGFQGIAYQAIILLIDSTVFLLHWRLRKRLQLAQV